MLRYSAQMTLLFVILLLVQVLICNHIMLFGFAMPIIFIYFIIRLPIGMSINWVMTLSFLLGLVDDFFSDSLGANALACLIIAVLKKPILLAYCQHDDSFNEIIPSISSLGIWNFSKFTLSIVLGYCFIFFSIEYFSIANIEDVLICTVCSTVLSFLLILGIESLLMTRREKRL